MGGKTSLVCLMYLTIFCSVYSENGRPIMDVALLMDSSDSYRSQNFDNETKFALEFVEQIFTKYTLISLFTFGSTANSKFNLDAFNDIQLMNQTITYMWYSIGNIDVSTAIEFSIKNGFSDSAGDRKCIPKALIILTHSPISELEALRISTLLKTKRIRCFILNMAGDSAIGNFIKITNASSRILPIADFNALESSANTMANLSKTDKGDTFE
ncbi:collagen alpha-1(XII) chain-like [Ruditapes philippinarum]|uniref:collagen alpha-1(XII) chain-like n=1 Tax=Ruditapes philippinarum TaxID=129788 RepID=UPI00295A7927|nr:collagen alpha-1(XII) chain-like [Ruditapes philippinarum]